MLAALPESVHRVAIVGFASLEQQALESFIALARTRTPSYEWVGSMEAAHFVVANGDRAGILDLLLAAQRMGDALLVGGQVREGATGWIERPIDPLRLFRALDTAVRRRELAQHSARLTKAGMTHAELREAWWSQAPANHEPIASASGEFHALTREEQRTIERGRPRLLPLPVRVPPGPGEPLLALVVDPHDDVWDLAKALQSHGISSERVSDSRGAFAAVQDQVFDLIVIAADLGDGSDLDGLSLAQAMKRQPRPYGEACPPVFLTSTQPTPLEAAQAMLAGAEAYLHRPVAHGQLTVALSDSRLRSDPDHITQASLIA